MAQSRTLITVLTWDRLYSLKKTLAHLYDKNPKIKADLLFLDNGSTEENYSWLSKKGHEVIKSEKNIGVFLGTRRLWLEAVSRGYDFILNLQDDFPCIRPIPLNDMYQFFDENADVGFIRLNIKKIMRRYKSKKGKRFDDGKRRNVVTNEKIRLKIDANNNQWLKYGDTLFAKYNYHFSFNPYIFPSYLVEILVGDISGQEPRERLLMERFEKTNLWGSRLKKPVFSTLKADHSRLGWTH